MRAGVSRVRRGISASEMIAIVAAIGITAFALWASLGTWTSDGMTELAGQVANPATLSTSFDGPTDDGGAGTSKRQRGNNGVGNGEDPPPPGLPPENDGAGTAPGNPGNRGGAWK